MNRDDKIKYLDDRLKANSIDDMVGSFALNEAENVLRDYEGTLKEEPKYQQYMELREGIAMQMVILKYRLM